MRNSWRLFLLFGALFWTGCATTGTGGQGKMTLNYIEYNRGKSFPVTADLSITTPDRQLTFYHLHFEDDSFYPDNSIIPNAFIKPLLQLKLDNASDAFTEPYYGFRFIHFFKKNPRLGVGIEFIHHKIFLDDHEQQVRVAGIDRGLEIDQTEAIKNYLDYFSVSHGINHISLVVVYRLMLLPSESIPDGRLQPYVTLAAGPTVPHLEMKLAETAPEWDAYSYQWGWKNFGAGLGLGLRYKPWQHFGFYWEYKFTYSHLHGMRFDDSEGSVSMDFTTHHLQWGISYMF
jgi:opacity protein-like surface antigen